MSLEGQGHDKCISKSRNEGRASSRLSEEGRSSLMPVAGFMMPLWETALLPALLHTHRVSLGVYTCEKMKYFHFNVQEAWHFHHVVLHQ